MNDHRRESTSLLVRELGNVARGFKRGWSALPPGAAVRWAVALLLLAVANFVLVWGVTRWTRHLADGRALQGEVDFMLGVEAWPIAFTDGIILESPTNIFILGPLTLIAAAVCFRFARTLEGLTILLGYGIARLLIWTGWHFWDRARPDLVADGAAALAAHSFPSGHAFLAFTTYGLLAAFWWQAARSVLDRVVAMVLLLALAFAVGIARLRLGAHWPSDVVAGWLLGALWLGSCLLALAAGRDAGPNRHAPPT